MSAAAGWYTDPGGTAGQLRWWDGGRWTEHVTADPRVTTVGGTPPPPAAEDLLAPAAAGAPAWGSGAGSAGSQPPPPPGGPGSTSAWGSAGSAWGGASHAPSWEPAPRPSGSGVRTGLIVAAVVGVLLVGLVGAVFVGVVGVVGSAGEFDVSVGTDAGFGDLGGEIASGGELVSGGRVRAHVPHGGSLELDLVVDEPGPVTVDVRGMGGFDAVAEITDEFGQVLAHNDDRASGRGGDHLDPLLDVDLDPGTYRVRVRGFGGEAGSVEVHRP